MNRPEKPQYSENWLGDHSAAWTLADSIADFWFNKGYQNIRVWVVERIRMGADGQPRTDYDIRSNLGPNGMPPGAEALAA